MFLRLSRRDLLSWLAGATALSACAPFSNTEKNPAHAVLPDEKSDTPPPARSAYADSVDALFDLILPAEFDAKGVVVAPGAREVGVDRLLELEHFARLAVSQGFLPSLPESVLVALDDSASSVRATFNRLLDARAQLEVPNSHFHALSLSSQEKIAQVAFDDDATRPFMLLARAACFVAYLGAVTSDDGLRALGFPPFEQLSEGVAVSGYPRTTSGRVVNPATENMNALAAAGLLDDYTFNRAPMPTIGDDLSSVLTPEGDLR